MNPCEFGSEACTAKKGMGTARALADAVVAAATTTYSEE